MTKKSRNILMKNDYFLFFIVECMKNGILKTIKNMIEYVNGIVPNILIIEELGVIYIRKICVITRKIKTGIDIVKLIFIKSLLYSFFWKKIWTMIIDVINVKLIYADKVKFTKELIIGYIIDNIIAMNKLFLSILLFWFFVYK